MIESLSEYLVSEEVLNSRLRRLTDNSLSLNSIALKEDTEGSLLGHPLDVYLLIRRMAIDLKEVNDLLRTKDHRLSDVQIRQIGDHSNHTNALNVTFDFDAAFGVISLVNTYDLDIKSLANGFIRSKSSSGAEVTSYENQFKFALSLNAFDCYLIGKQTFDNKEYSNAKQWLTEAVDRLDDMTSDEIIADIFNYLSFCELKIGKPSEAQKYKRLSAAIKPDIETNELISEIKVFNDTNTTSSRLKEPIYHSFHSANVYQLCRGERLLNDSIVSKLKCFHLNTTKTSFLRLTRIKVEEMYKSPQIVVIHELLSEYETQTIISMAQPSLERLYVFGDEGKRDVNDGNRRLAQGSIIWDTQHKLMHTISRRIGAITGLNMDFVEPYKAMKYRVGGYFNDNFDTYFYKPNTTYMERIITWINYLSDVGAGGATVFTRLNVTVRPAKYSAVFWHNLDKSGELDGQTLHSGCPVKLLLLVLFRRLLQHLIHAFIREELCFAQQFQCMDCETDDRNREFNESNSTGYPRTQSLTESSVTDTKTAEELHKLMPQTLMSYEEEDKSADVVKAAVTPDETTLPVVAPTLETTPESQKSSVERTSGSQSVPNEDNQN
ncbi:unnamed protein product [Oppiella nova]|uniref:Prolyl 4-hydroxylase alpha subunit domain-containing protein n=1 Tax=Oppiella nova TaxID=334625 RepID=A0A7R9M5M8_9ACAR|nr:unnamed protein product [Oppiella nova]CAG2171222.1 unnamed protein product [Oppiella nova]